MQSTETNNPRPIGVIWYEYMIERYLWSLYSVKGGGIKWNSVLDVVKKIGIPVA